MAIIEEGNLKCTGCGEHVKPAPEDGAGGRLPENGESQRLCGQCATQVKTPQEEFNCHRLTNNTIRHVGKPRWVATYESNWATGGRRRVGLLVPRPTKRNPLGRSQIAFARNGKLVEFQIGESTEGSHGEWYSARAGELPREQWQAIRAFYNNLPPRR